MIDIPGDLREIEVNGARLHYVEAGQGEPVVFVHGSLADYRAWAPQIEVLARTYRVISYSRRYHFPNACPDDDASYSATTHAGDLAALIDTRGLAPARIVSASYGSYIALLHALHRPDQVRALVVAEPPMLGWLDELPGGADLARQFRDAAWSPSVAAFAAGDDLEGVRRFVDGVAGVSGAFDRLSPAARAALMANASEMRTEARSDRLFPQFRCRDARRVTAPTLLLEAERSPLVFHRITQELADCLPQAERLTVARSTHLINASAPRAYNRIVLDFLARCDDTNRHITRQCEPAIHALGD